jgi:uroporphyrinogen III methyltransferase/synthase
LAENAGDTLERALTAAGAICTRFNVYRTIPASPAATKRAMSTFGADNVIFASPTAVQGFVQQVTVDVPIKVYTIGPSTSAAARAAGLTVTAEAREPSLEGILESMQWQR